MNDAVFALAAIAFILALIRTDLWRIANALEKLVKRTDKAP